MHQVPEAGSGSRRPPVWHDAMRFVEKAYHLAAVLPSSERYELSSQLRRAAISIVANITEGHARRGPRALRAFLNVAYGSAREAEVLIEVAGRLKLAPDDLRQQAEAALTTVVCQLFVMLRGLQRNLESGRTLR